jgi:hypothetical protein
MRNRTLATWLSLLLVVVALGRPAPAGRQAPPADSVPFDPALWSPANPSAGGLVFLVSPADAEIYVDGGYAGRPHQFSPARPLRLGAGQHRIELFATGYSTARLDVPVLAGFVATIDVVMAKR